MNGMEMMIPHLIKGLGLDPEKIKEVLTDATTKVKLFDAKLDAIQASLTSIQLKLESMSESELVAIVAQTPVDAAYAQVNEVMEGYRGRHSNGNNDN